jgi:hypothetical protein
MSWEKEMDDSSVSDDQAEEAIDWLVRLRADNVSYLEKQLFIVWWGGNRLNPKAFAEALSLWDGLSVVSGMCLSDVSIDVSVIDAADFDKGSNEPKLVVEEFEQKRKLEAVGF